MAVDVPSEPSWSVARFGIAGGDMNELRTPPCAFDELRRLRGALRWCRSVVELRSEDVCIDTRLVPVCGREDGGDGPCSGKG